MGEGVEGAEAEVRFEQLTVKTHLDSEASIRI